MSYYEDRYIDYLAEQDAQFGGDAWADNYNPKVSLEKKLMPKNEGLENVRCPECAGEMISRSGKYGIFWGCKEFPNCKGTRDNQGRSKQDRANEKMMKESDERGDEWPKNREDKVRWNQK